MGSYHTKWAHKFELSSGKWVFVPSQGERKYGTALKNQLNNIYTFPNNYWHQRRGGHLDALRTHLNSTTFSTIDLSDFFNSISKNRISLNLKSKLGHKEAQEIANRSTVVHSVTGRTILPFGFVQSPIIASLCLKKSRLGTLLNKLSGEPNLIISVYMDDIIISGNDEKQVLGAYDKIKESVVKYNFQVNKEKSQSPATTVEVFNIELSHNNLKLTDSRLSAFRRDLANDSSSDSKVKGIERYIASVKRIATERWTSGSI